MPITFPNVSLERETYFEIYDDFVYSVTTAISDQMAWTITSDGSTGTPVYQDAAGGWFNIVTAAADNDYVAYSSVNESFKFAADKPLWFDIQFKLTEATTSESTFWAGFTDTLTTGGMQANTAGPLASFDGALIYKTPETALTMNCMVSNTAVQSSQQAFATHVSGATQRMQMYFDGGQTYGSTTGLIIPHFYNGTTWTQGQGLTFLLSGMDEMHMVWGVKAGPGGGAETFMIDYIRCVQKR